MLQQEDEKTRRILVYYSRTVGIEPAMRAAPAVALRTYLESGREKAQLRSYRKVMSFLKEVLASIMYPLLPPFGV